MKKSPAKSNKGKRTIVLILVGFIIVVTAFVLVPYLKQKELAEKDAQGQLLLKQQSYEEAITLYRGMDGFEQADQRIEEAKAGIREREYRKAEVAFLAGKMIEAEALYLTLHPYQQSSERLDTIKAWKIEYAKKLIPFMESSKKYGYRDPSGSIVLPADYLSAGHFVDGLAPVAVEQKGPERNYTFDDSIMTYIDASGKEVFSQRFAVAGEFRNGHAIVALGEYRSFFSDEVGVIDINGEFVLQPTYQELRWINDSEMIAKIGGRFGVINLQGEVLLEPTFHEFDDFFEGMASVSYDKKWGYITSEDYHIIVRPQFGSADRFFQGVAKVSSNGEYGLIDKAGKYIIPLQKGYMFALNSEYSERQRPSLFMVEVPQVNHDLLFVLQEKIDASSRSSDVVYTVYDATGKVIIAKTKAVDDSYDKRPEIMGEFICITTGFSSRYSSKSKTDPQKRTLYTMDGKVVAVADWIKQLPSSNEESWFILINGKSESLLTPALKQIDIEGAMGYEIISSDCIAVKVNNKWGLINARGELIASYQWDQIEAPSEGIMKAKAGGKWGYLTESGTILSKPVWDDATDFQNGRAIVKQKSLYDYIDSTGIQITFAQYDEAYSYSDGFARVNSLGKWGYLDSSGKVFIALAWDKATDFENGFAYVAKGDQHYRLSIDGSQREVETDNARFLAKSTKSSSTTYKPSSETKTKKCLQCGAPIYADETWCDDCLFGAFFGK